MAGRMQDKVVLITGAGTGIGRASAERLAEEGAHVAICGRRPEPLAETAAAIRAKGGSVEAIVLDVGDLDAFAKTIADLARRKDRLDALVNNAMSVTYKTVADTTLEEWRQDFRINSEAVFIGTQAALKVMIPQKSGAVVNIASVNGVRAMPGMSSYSASKAAMIQFGAVAAMEAAPSGVRVNTIVPGKVLTPAAQRFDATDPDRIRRTSAAIPMLRGGQPKELADAVLFLTSDESTFITGACLHVDGGKAAQLYVPQ